MVLVQKCPFFQIFFLGNISQENVFYDIPEQKNIISGYKKKRFKKSKNWHFFKGVNPWFWSKNGHFSNFFFLGNIDQENVFYDILERKNTFLGYKKRGSKSRKIDIFLWNLSNEIGLTMDIFPTFFFRQYRPGKCPLRYSTTRKRLSRL